MNSIIVKMNNIKSCENCQNASLFWEQYNYSSTETRKVRINAQLAVYRDGLKAYVKMCCLYSYYFGNVNQMSSNAKQSIPLQLKAKHCKYVITDNESFQVYELQIKKSEKIDDPESSLSSRKIQVTRDINIYDLYTPYKVLTKSAYDKEMNKIKKQQVASCKKDTESGSQYVYLIQERTAVVANQSIYKIGRTEQNNFERFKGYGKGYKILLHMICDDCKNTEQIILETFKTKYRQATEYGSEYFEGSHKEMIQDIMTITLSS